MVDLFTLAFAKRAPAMSMSGGIQVEAGRRVAHVEPKRRVERLRFREVRNAEAEVIVLTEAVAVKETGPRQTVAKFGEVYSFSPTFIAIRRDVPTMLTFWNLQSDDEHDFMLTAPDATVLMHLKLMPLTRTSYVFTFHKDGIFNFYCAVHQPEMNGQILVLPPINAK